MRRFLITLAVLAIAGFAVFWWLTAPKTVAYDLPDGDIEKGAIVFSAGGCASCHAAPGAKGEEKRVLAGGLGLHTPFGTFHAPNISPNKDHGLGAWTAQDFANAMKQGTSPDGTHYYPAFPFTSYTRMTDGDVADLWAYMATLPASATPSIPHELPFPFSIRRGLGLWKLLNLNADPITTPSDDPIIERGRYLVEGPSHCGECHTPRDLAGGLNTSRWLAGGPNPDGKGTIPAINGEGLKDWSAADIAYSLESGFTPDFDSLGGSMADVVLNTAQLPASDREAIAVYLKSLP